MNQDPIHLEPEFIPFFGHKISQPHFKDDGIRKNIFQKALDIFRFPNTEEIFEVEDVYEEVKAYPLEDLSPLTTIRLTFPKGIKMPV